MLVLFLIVLLSVLNPRVHASHIGLRQDTNNGCIAACYPPRHSGSDQKAYNTDLCTDEVSVVLVCLQQEGCSGSELAAAVSDLKSRCNSVGVNLSFSLNTPLNTQIATPTNTPPPTLTTHSTRPSDTLTTPPTASPIVTGHSEIAVGPSITSTGTPPSPSPSPSSDNSSPTNIGLIVGGIVGLIVALAVFLCATILYCRRHSRTSQTGSPSASSSFASSSRLPLLRKDDGRGDESVVGVHKTDGGFNDPIPEHSAVLVRRPTEGSYEQDTRRQDIGSVLKPVSKQNSPNYEEGEGLLREASGAGHRH